MFQYSNITKMKISILVCNRIKYWNIIEEYSDSRNRIVFMQCYKFVSELASLETSKFCSLCMVY